MLNNLYVNPWGMALIIGFMVVCVVLGSAILIAEHKSNQPN